MIAVKGISRTSIFLTSLLAESVSRLFSANQLSETVPSFRNLVNDGLILRYILAILVHLNIVVPHLVVRVNVLCRMHVRRLSRRKVVCFEES